MKLNKLILLFTTACLVFAQSALAARMGGGRSYGMQRNYSKPNYNNNAGQQRYSQPQPTTAAQPQQRPGMGAGTAAVLGAAAGAAGGYMLGKSMSDNGNNTSHANASNVQTATATSPINESKMPWGTLAILGALLILGLMLFRRKATAGLSSGQDDNSQPLNSNYNNQQQNPGFNIPTINRNQMPNAQQPGYNTMGNPGATNPQINVTPIDSRMPDGVETVYFLRQVKGMFLHVQSMNNSENISEIEKYMTPTLYQEIKSTILDNSSVADFSTLDCQLLDCEVINNQLIASVKFFGMVSDEPTQPAKPFSEVWNFVKTDLNTGKWLVAGIQQETLA